MKKILKGDKVALALIILVVALSSVSALPGIPNQFWGSVKDSSGNSAPDGVLVIAKINSQDVAAGTTKEGSYGLSSPQFYIQDPDGNRAGKTIEFFVNDVKIAQYPFSNGGTVELNLIATGDFGVSQPSSSSSSGGSSGGGGGGSSSGGAVIIAKNTTMNQTSAGECTEDWECSDWLDCVGGIEKRVCTDKNSCGAENSSPEMERNCETQNPKSSSGITGAVTGIIDGIKSRIILIIGIIFVLGIVALTFFSRRKK